MIGEINLLLLQIIIFATFIAMTIILGRWMVNNTAWSIFPKISSLWIYLFTILFSLWVGLFINVFIGVAIGIVILGVFVLYNENLYKFLYGEAKVMVVYLADNNVISYEWINQSKIVDNDRYRAFERTDGSSKIYFDMEIVNTRRNEALERFRQRAQDIMDYEADLFPIDFGDPDQITCSNINCDSTEFIELDTPIRDEDGIFDGKCVNCNALVCLSLIIGRDPVRAEVRILGEDRIWYNRPKPKTFLNETIIEKQTIKKITDAKRFCGLCKRELIIKNKFYCKDCYGTSKKVVDEEHGL